MGTIRALGWKWVLGLGHVHQCLTARPSTFGGAPIKVGAERQGRPHGSGQDRPQALPRASAGADDPTA